MHIHTWGKLAEYLVIIRYLLFGYVPIKHRWKVRSGEIDVIFKRGSSLVFCEVKARSSDFATDQYVSNNQKFRLKRSAEVFLSRYHKMNLKEVRFDLVIVKSIFSMLIYTNWLDS
jgi:putative endonuclease